ncbi:MAG: nucleoside recognition protein [Desulfobacteraceae bacterium]|nr:nucleoside recognition protein [Desulfobacteraceae bacterium]
MKQTKVEYRYLAFSILVTIIMIVFTINRCETVSVVYAIKNLGFPVVRLMSFIAIGLAIGQIIETLGWTKKMSIIARPVFKFSNLGDRCGAAFVSAFFSGVVANSMLVEFFKENKISKMQLFLTNYLNQLPAYFLHLPTTIFIVLPLTGFAGLIYFGLTFSAVLMRFVLFLIFGKIYFSSNPDSALNDDSSDNNSPDLTGKNDPKGYCTNITGDSTSFKISLILKEKLLPRMLGIFLWVVPIYTFVFLLNSYEIFDYINNIVSSKISTSILPVHSLSVVVISFAAEFTSGFAAAGALMDAGVLSIKETVIALLLGNIIAFPIRALRHQIPRYLGIFSPKMGLSLLLTGQSFRITSLIIVGLIYYMAG